MSQATKQNTVAQREKLLQEMERDLRRCHTMIIRAVVLRSVYRMVLDFVPVLATAAVAEILSSTVRLFAGEALYRVGIGSLGPGVAGLVVVVVGTCLVVVQAFRRTFRQQPSIGETAERLDLAVEDHNRIATAWWLLHSNARGPMVDAAIEDGLIHLKLFRGCKPDRSGSTPVWADYRGRLWGTSLLVLVAILFQPAMPYFPTISDLQPEQTARGSQDQKILPAEVTDILGPPEVKRRQPAASKRSELSSMTSSTASAVSQKLSGSEKVSGGFSGGGNRSSVPSPSVTSAAGRNTSDFSSSTEGKPSSTQGRERAADAKQPYHEAEAVLKQKDLKGGSSSSSPGSSDGRSMIAVGHDWEQHAQAVGLESEDQFDDEEVDEKDEPRRQPDGIQPLLEDRNESPSRELGISHGDGSPSTGRGGPSPPKKSRGTASLVLGVPMPDFVRGHLLPGPVKISHRQVRPVPVGAESSDSDRAKRRTLPEPVVPRTTLPAETLSLVREYLIRLHQTE